MQISSSTSSTTVAARLHEPFIKYSRNYVIEGLVRVIVIIVNYAFVVTAIVSGCLCQVNELLDCI